MTDTAKPAETLPAPAALHGIFGPVAVTTTLAGGICAAVIAFDIVDPAVIKFAGLASAGGLAVAFRKAATVNKMFARSMAAGLGAACTGIFAAEAMYAGHLPLNLAVLLSGIVAAGNLWWLKDKAAMTGVLAGALLTGALAGVATYHRPSEFLFKPQHYEFNVPKTFPV